MAMPGIMRALMVTNMAVVTASTAHSGTWGPGHRRGREVSTTRGRMTASAAQRNMRALPRRSVRRPTARATGQGDAMSAPLVARPLGHLFGPNVTRVAFKRGAYLRLRFKFDETLFQGADPAVNRSLPR